MTRPRRIALVAGTVVLLGTAFALTFTHPEVFSLMATPHAAADQAHGADHAHGTAQSEFHARELSPTEVKAMLDRGETIILADVRGQSSYATKHITGAVSMPASEIDTWAAKVKPDDLVVFYCSCVDDGASLATAQLAEEQYKLSNVAILKGGLRAWQAEGLPMTVK